MPALLPVIFLLIVQLCSSCTKEETSLKETLEQIGIIADTEPDSAYTAIKSIDSEALRSRRAIAMHALVYSKVLDKNMIDIRSDSIIAPAIEYYSRKSSENKLCEAFYYAARIQENSGNPSKAMEFLHKAEEEMGSGYSPLYGLIYSSKARLYHNSIEYKAAAYNYLKASEVYQNLNDWNRYSLNRIREADCIIKYGEYDYAEEIVGSLDHLLDILPERTLNKYYQVVISLSEKKGKGNADELSKVYEDAIRNKSILDWIMVARVNLAYGNVDYALEALEMHKRHNGEDGMYFYSLAKAYEAKGGWQEATEAYKSYIRMHSQIGAGVLSQDTKFVEEREEHKSRYERERSHRIILSLAISAALLALMLAAVTIAAIRKELKIRCLEKAELQRQIDGLMEEREELVMLENSNREGRKIISERLRIIDHFVMSDAFNDKLYEEQASERLKKIISDRKEFVRQNRLIFNQSSVRFITYLKECGLDDREIDHCCLYAIGMNGKMVTAFTNLKRHYHIGSDVRKKLGLNGHDTNISIHIRNLYKRLESDPEESDGDRAQNISQC